MSRSLDAKWSVFDAIGHRSQNLDSRNSGSIAWLARNLAEETGRMTKLLSAKETIRYSPTGEENGLPEHRITYSLRVPTVYDRARLRRACLARGARHWTDLEMMLVLENGVRELLKSEADAEQRGLFLADIEIYTAHVAAGDEPPSELADRIDDIEAAVAWGYLPHGQSLRRHLRTSEKGDDSQRSDRPAMTIISSKDWPRCVGIGGHN